MSTPESRFLGTCEGSHREAFTATDWIWLGGPALIWGCSFLFIAEALESFSPGVIVAGRIALGAAALSCVRSARRTSVARSDWPRIALPELDGSERSAASGVALVVLAMTSYAFSANISVPLTQTYGSLAVIWRTQLAAVLWSAPFAVRGLATAEFKVSGIAAVVALGIGGTAIAQIMAAHLMARVGATRGSMITYAMPIVAIMAGVIFRSETITIVSLIGIAVVLIGAAMASRSET